MGDPTTAQVVILALNPKAGEQYIEPEPAFDRELRLSLTFQSNTSFYPLDPRFHKHSGYKHWHRLLREVILECGIEKVGGAIACVEWLPYQSPNFPLLPKWLRLPSQMYGFSLVHQAIQNNAVILGPKRLPHWRDDVSALGAAEIVEFQGVRGTTHLSLGNLGRQNFDKVCERIANARKAG
jgi:hypothetical protein